MMERRDSTLYRRNKKRMLGSYDELVNNHHNFSSSSQHSHLSSQHPQHLLSKRSTDRFQRSGKWTNEEENFANRLIVEFEAGTLLDCEEGCTLRSYLARRLRCAPMRISKKFAGRCIGKLIFSRRSLAIIHEPFTGVNHGNTLDQLESLYHKSYQSSGHMDDMDGYEDDVNSISESYGFMSTSSSNMDSSTEVDQPKHAFVSRRSEAALQNKKLRRGVHGSNINHGYADMFVMGNQTPTSDPTWDRASPTTALSMDEYMDNVDLFEEDSLDNDMDKIRNNQHVSTLVALDSDHGYTPWDHSVMETEEWLDVLSFFCGHPDDTKKYLSADRNGMGRNRSNVILPVY